MKRYFLCFGLNPMFQFFMSKCINLNIWFRLSAYHSQFSKFYSNSSKFFPRMKRNINSYVRQFYIAYSTVFLYTMMLKDVHCCINGPVSKTEAILSMKTSFTTSKRISCSLPVSYQKRLMETLQLSRKTVITLLLEMLWSMKSRRS